MFLRMAKLGCRRIARKLFVYDKTLALSALLRRKKELLSKDGAYDQLQRQRGFLAKGVMMGYRGQPTENKHREALCLGWKSEPGPEFDDASLFTSYIEITAIP